VAQQLLAQINDFTSEMATVYKGGNASTDESLRLASENLKGEWNEEVFKRSVKELKKTLSYRVNSISNTPVAGQSQGSMYNRSSPPPSGNMHFTDGLNSWDIPAADVERFKAAHPNAKQGGR